jgi:putative ABC transport system permease protein
MGAVMIIYYKQVSEGFDDRKRFQIPGRKTYPHHI